MFLKTALPSAFPQPSSKDAADVILLILDALLSALGVLLLVPIMVFATEIASAVWGRRTAPVASGGRPTLAVLIPAHNEEGGIRATLQSIVPQLALGDRLVVVADNCTDGTRYVAEAEGAEVISRSNLEKRGKGFALDHGLQHLVANPPEVVIIVDADCQVAPGSIDLLAKLCGERRRPIQAQYLMRNEENARLKMRVAEFAWLVKNLVRPLGLAQLGLPCLLTGSGMAFPWPSISKMNLADGHIVEDMKMGLDLARLGTAPVFCPGALVLSMFPTQEDGIKSQRTRWEHGHLGTMLSEAPGMVTQGLQQRDFALVALAMDLCVPPLALLVLQVAALWVVAGVFSAITGFHAPVLIMSAAALILALAVLTAWASHGRRIISFADLISACTYALCKIPMYVRFVFSRQSEWVRSKRDKDS
jgi:cellulose synthase/poly-beta-1,6-N-acetylglucosamine synthase-like glycosyltransferase